MTNCSRCGYPRTRTSCARCLFVEPEDRSFNENKILDDVDDPLHPDPTEGLPDDLARSLRDPSVIIPQDAAVFGLIASWANAPAPTLSAMTVDEWQHAWSVVQRRVDALERQLAEVTKERDELRHHGSDWVAEKYKELHAAAQAFLDSFYGPVFDTYETATQLRKLLDAQ